MSSDTVQYYIETHVGEEIQISKEQYDNPQDFNPPEGVYVFRFYKRNVVLIKSTEPLLVLGNPMEISKWYIIGTIYTLDEVQQKFPDERQVVLTMQSRNTKQCVRCPNDTWYLWVDQIVLDR